jgi:hypothetical protein
MLCKYVPYVVPIVLMCALFMYVLFFINFILCQMVF